MWWLVVVSVVADVMIVISLLRMRQETREDERWKRERRARRQAHVLGLPWPEEENMSKKNNSGASGGYISKNSGRSNYRGGKNNSRAASGNRYGNQRGPGSGGAGGAMLWLAVALLGLPVAVVGLVLGYLVVT